MPSFFSSENFQPQNFSSPESVERIVSSSSPSTRTNIQHELLQSSHDPEDNSSPPHKKKLKFITKKVPKKKQPMTSPTAAQADFPSHHYPVHLLQPLKSTAGPKKKWVELYCKGLKKVICCFRGHQDAATALNLDRNVVKSMCEKKANNVPIYSTFSLMYASNKVQAPAYHYGIHELDFKPNLETYHERIARFESTHIEDKNLYSKKNSSLNGKKNMVAPPTNEIPLRNLLPGQDHSKQKPLPPSNNLMVTVVENEEQLLSHSLQFQNMCIFCQDTLANVILQPCKHCVLCQECFESGTVRKFCPVCRIGLMGSVKAEKHVKYVRPRVFSPYVLDDL